jgi:hypothetical protein
VPWCRATARVRPRSAPARTRIPALASVVPALLGAVDEPDAGAHACYHAYAARDEQEKGGHGHLVMTRPG